MDNYLKCKINYLKCKCLSSLKDINWLSRWKHVHVCTSTYHIILLDPHIVCNFFILLGKSSSHYGVQLQLAFIFVWLLIVKADKHLLLLWLCNYNSLNTIVLWLVKRKIIEFCITKLSFKRKTCNHLLKFRCI